MMGVGVCVLKVSGDVGSCRRVSGVVCTFRWLNEQKNLNNLGIRLANCQNLFGKIDFLFSSIRKNRFSDPEKPEKSISVLKVFGKIDFHYSGEVTHPRPQTLGPATMAPYPHSTTTSSSRQMELPVKPLTPWRPVKLVINPHTTSGLTLSGEPSTTNGATSPHWTNGNTMHH